MIYDLTSQETSNYGRERGTVYSTLPPVGGPEQKQKKLNDFIEFNTHATSDSILLNDSYFKVEAHFDGDFSNNPTFTPTESPFETIISKFEIYINGTLAESVNEFGKAAKASRCLMSSREALSSGDNMYVIDDDNARYPGWSADTGKIMVQNAGAATATFPWIKGYKKWKYLNSEPAKKRRNEWFTCDDAGNITGAAGKHVHFPYTPPLGLFSKASQSRKIFKGDLITVKFFLDNTTALPFVRGSTWAATAEVPAVPDVSPVIPANDGSTSAKGFPETEQAPPANCRLVIDSINLVLRKVLPSETIELDMESIVRDEQKIRYYDYSTMTCSKRNLAATDGSAVITNIYNGPARPKFVLVFFEHPDSELGGSKEHNTKCPGYYESIGLDGAVNITVNGSRYPSENEEVRIAGRKYTEMLHHIRDIQGGENLDIHPVITHSSYPHYPFLVFDTSKTYDPSDNLKNNEVTEINLELTKVTTTGVAVYTVAVFDKTLQIQGRSTVVIN